MQLTFSNTCGSQVPESPCEDRGLGRNPPFLIFWRSSNIMAAQARKTIPSILIRIYSQIIIAVGIFGIVQVLTTFAVSTWLTGASYPFLLSIIFSIAPLVLLVIGVFIYKNRDTRVQLLLGIVSIFFLYHSLATFVAFSEPWSPVFWTPV